MARIFDTARLSMATTVQPPTQTQLVVEGLHLIAARDAAIAELRAIDEKLIALGAGRYCSDEDGKSPIATVVGAVPGSVGASSYALRSKEDEEGAREIAGDQFKTLFDRTVFYRPCAGFADVTPKILTPAKSRDLLELCYVPGSPISGKRAHVRWPSK